MQLNVDAVDGRGYTALFVACWRGNTEGRAACAQLLIDEGADVNFKTEKLWMTGMHWACCHGDRALVELLLKHDAK